MTAPAERLWALSHRADVPAVAIADRHYNRQKIGSPQFVPPGRCLVLLTPSRDALWVTSWPFAEYVRHAWPGAMVNSLFRREPECPHRASDLIRAAVAATAAEWSPPNLPHPIVSFVNADKVRHKRDPGRCYLRAGWERIGTTAGGLLAFGLPLADWPAPVDAIGSQLTLIGACDV